MVLAQSMTKLIIIKYIIRASTYASLERSVIPPLVSHTTIALVCKPPKVPCKSAVNQPPATTTAKKRAASNSRPFALSQRRQASTAFVFSPSFRPPSHDIDQFASPPSKLKRALLTMANTAAPSSPLRSAYLVVYNALSAAAWAVVLYKTALTWYTKDNQEVFFEVGEWTKWTQTAAALEILHSLFGKSHVPIW